MNQRQEIRAANILKMKLKSVIRLTKTSCAFIWCFTTATWFIIGGFTLSSIVAFEIGTWVVLYKTKVLFVTFFLNL